MTLQKHSVSIRGHRTSFSLEEPFWLEFQSIAKAMNMPAARLITQLDETRDTDQNLSSTIRVFVLEQIKAKAASLQDKAHP